MGALARRHLEQQQLDLGAERVAPRAEREQPREDALEHPQGLRDDGERRHFLDAALHGGEEAGDGRAGGGVLAARLAPLVASPRPRAPALRRVPSEQHQVGAGDAPVQGHRLHLRLHALRLRLRLLQPPGGQRPVLGLKVGVHVVRPEGGVAARLPLPHVPPHIRAQGHRASRVRRVARRRLLGLRLRRVVQRALLLVLARRRRRRRRRPAPQELQQPLLLLGVEVPQEGVHGAGRGQLFVGRQERLDQLLEASPFHHGRLVEVPDQEVAHGAGQGVRGGRGSEVEGGRGGQVQGAAQGRGQRRGLLSYGLQRWKRLELEKPLT